MDPLMIVGLLVTLASIVVSTLMDGNSFAPLIGPSSLVLVSLGSLGATLMSFRKSDLGRLPKAVAAAVTSRPPDLEEAVNTLASLAEVARKEGMLAVESHLEEVEDDFLRSGVQLLVDGMDADQVENLLSIDIAALDERHQMPIAFLRAAGSFAPTFGMVGTVIGLINMLGNLTDPSQLGAGMSVALLTTLYGVLLANIFYLPVSNRLERYNKLELSARDMILDGVLALHAGLSPRMLVERLETYLPPEQRVGHQARMGRGETPEPVEAEAA